MNENKFAEKMHAHTDEALKRIIVDRQKYVPEALEAAIAELEARGIVVENADAMLQECAQPEEENKIKRDYWDTVQHVEDESAPLLYPKRAVYTFSVLFSVVFGAVLMMKNLRVLNKPEGVVPTISFSIAFLSTVIVVSEFVESHYGVNIHGTYIASLGGWLLIKLLWDKYIGKEVQYRKQSLVVPSIIGLAFVACFIALMEYGNTANENDENGLTSETHAMTPGLKQTPVMPDLMALCNRCVASNLSGGRVYFNASDISETDAKGAFVVLEMVDYFRPSGSRGEYNAYYYKSGEDYVLAFCVNPDAFASKEVENKMKTGIKELERTYGSRKYRFRMIAMDSAGNRGQERYIDDK